MVSKKKAKGQARKAAKAKKEAEEKDPPSVVDDAVALEAQMQRLSANNANRDRSSCNHGFDSATGDKYVKFGKLVSNKFIDILDNCEGEEINPFFAVIEDLLEEHGEVFEDTAKMELMVSQFAAVGTTSVIMDNNIDANRLFAAFAEYFKQMLAVLRENQSCFNDGKIFELYLGDEHTLVSYLRKNIPCNCLDEKYNEVKGTVKKMGLCRNNDCIHPRCQVERSKMFKCSRCLSVSYCSSECQAAHWCEHKKWCKKLSKSKEH